GAALSVMQNPYIESARAIGSGHLRIVLRHVVPNVMATVIILATIGLGGVILAESALSFLGLGVPPPRPSWGSMLAGSGRSYMQRAPWMAIFPGLAISLAVFGFHRAQACRLLSDLLVATDSEEVVEACHAHHVPAVLTSSDHRSGTDRLWEVSRARMADVYVNIQGDEPLVTTGHIETLVRP